MKIKSLLLVLVLALTTAACSRVDVGHEGIIVNKLGTDKGMQLEAKTPGRYWVGINEDLYTFPVYTQTKVWTDDARDGSHNSEEFNITTQDGGQFKLDIGINFRVGTGQAPLVFQKWRTNIHVVTNTHMRRLVQDKFTKVGSSYTAFEVMSKRSEIVERVQTALTSEIAVHGIVVEKVFMIGIQAPKAIEMAMERKMEAVEKTAQRQQEVERAKAEADILIAEARGKAEATAIEGKALELNPMVLKARAIEKWDGVLPKVTGNSDVMIDLGDLTND